MGKIQMDLSLQGRIRERAYEIWNAGGRMHGQGEQHWIAAERQVLAEMAAQLSATPPVAEQKKPPVRQRRPLTNVRPQPKKVANGG
jgi:hypothetical protein